MGIKEFDSFTDKLSLKEKEDLYWDFVKDDYECRPVDINTFIDDPYYLGSYFSGLEGGFSGYSRKTLNLVFPTPFNSSKRLIILTGGIGTAKTTTAALGLLYETYLLNCQKNPQRLAGILDSDRIQFALFNVTTALATGVCWEKVKELIVSSEYFKKHTSLEQGKRKSDIPIFPAKKIDFMSGSLMHHALGRAVYSAFLDEAEFDIRKEQTAKNFNQLLRRIESRFTRKSKRFPGRVWIVSSESAASSTINQLLSNYKNQPGVLVRRASIWDVHPHKYGKERFPVFVGNAEIDPQIISPENKELLKNQSERIIYVPLEARSSFEADIWQALRDLAGVPVSGRYALFPSGARLDEAQAGTVLFPDIISLDAHDKGDVVFDYCKNKDYFSEPANNSVARYIHIDTALTGDLMGVSACYIADFEDIITTSITTHEKVKETVPIVVVEFCFCVQARPGQQIPFYKIRGFIRNLKDMGYPIGRVSTDTYQHVGILQDISTMGIMTNTLSVDRTAEPYYRLRSAINEERIILPKSALLKRELLQLEVSPDGKKVDHPAIITEGNKPSKDLSDAVCGSYVNCLDNAGGAMFMKDAEEFFSDMDKQDELMQVTDDGVSFKEKLEGKLFGIDKQKIKNLDSIIKGGM